MLIQIVSDIHIEHWLTLYKGNVTALLRDSIKPVGDVLVIAGDLCELAPSHKKGLIGEILEGIIEILGDKPIIWVLGNHEYYRGSPGLIANIIKELETKYPQLHILQSGHPVEINGKRFIGGELWFEKPINPLLKRYMNDFTMINGLEPWCYQQNAKLVKHLKAELREGDVLVTHHAPSYKCVTEGYQNSPINCFFVHDLSELIVERKPVVALCGHVHSSHDCSLGDTRVVCNAMAYPNENNDFEPGKVVEI